MAILRGNPLVGQIQGMVGDLVIANHKPGIKVLRKRPVRTAPPTENERVNQGKLRDTIAWAKSIWADDPSLKEKYSSAGRAQHRRGFDLAKADFLRPPKVEDIDLSGYTGNSGEMIRVKAVDDFEVKEVRVSIQELDGTVIEEGAAELEAGQWVYEATTTVKKGETVVVQATAKDHPGHAASRRADHACGLRD